MIEYGEGEEEEDEERETGANDDDDADDAENLGEENVENEGKRRIDGVKVRRKTIQNATRGRGREERKGSLG